MSEIGATQESKGTERSGLFRRPFYSDWAAVLGITFVAIGAFSLTRTRDISSLSKSSEILGVSIDTASSIAIQGLLWGILPAAIRRWRLSKPSSRSSEYKTLRTSHFWFLVVLAGIVGSGVGVAVALPNSSATLSVSDACTAYVVAYESAPSLDLAGAQVQEALADPEIDAIKIEVDALLADLDRNYPGLSASVGRGTTITEIDAEYGPGAVTAARDFGKRFLDLDAAIRARCDEVLGK